MKRLIYALLLTCIFQANAANISRAQAIERVTSSIASQKIYQMNADLKQFIKERVTSFVDPATQEIDETLIPGIADSIIAAYEAPTFTNQELTDAAVAAAAHELETTPASTPFATPQNSDAEYDDARSESPQATQNDNAIAQALQHALTEQAGPSTAFTQAENDRALALALALSDVRLEDDDSRVIPLLNQAPYSITSQEMQQMFMHTNGQVGATCGYHAAINALAIQHLLDRGIKITQDAVKAEAQNHLHLIQGAQNIEIGQIIEFVSHKAQLRNCYFLAIQGNEIIPAGTGTDNNYSMQQLFDLFGTDRPLCAHFILNTGGHWVVFTVVQQNQEIQLFYQDSNNTVPEPGMAQYQLIQSIYTLAMRKDHGQK